jgi:putative ABC transport system permease protein
MDLELSQTYYTDGEKQLDFYRQMLDRLSNLAGVKSVGIVNPLPISGFSNQSSALPEGIPLSRENVVTSDFLVASPGYFGTMGMQVLRGRDFNKFDKSDTPLVIIVDELTAQRFWPNQDPVGKRMAFEFNEEDRSRPPTPIYRQVVGVVRHIKHNGLMEESRQQIYVPYLQMPYYYRGMLPQMSLVVRAVNPQGLIPTVRSAVASLDNNSPLYNINTMEQKLSDSVARNRLSAFLMGTFGILGLVLAVIGISGLMSHSVTQRTQEIGIRMALGAQRRDVLRLIIGQGMMLVAFGLAFGLGGSLLMTPVLSNLLFAVSASDPATYLAVAVVLAGVALVACYLPARRATKIDPIVALRYE